MANILAGGWVVAQNSERGSAKDHSTSLGTIGPAVSEEIIFKWLFAEFSIFSNSGHIGWRPGSSDTILKDDHLKTIPP